MSIVQKFYPYLEPESPRTVGEGWLNNLHGILAC
jgi:hypothetical protein